MAAVSLRLSHSCMLKRPSTGGLTESLLPLRGGSRHLTRRHAAAGLDAPSTTIETAPPAEKPVGSAVPLSFTAEPSAVGVPDAVVEIEEPVPKDVVAEFEHKLEADLKTVGVTLTAVTGVIIFWRGIWSLLDYFLEDSLFGDICCIIVGLTIVLWIRLTGVKVSPTFWPPS